MFSRCRYSRYSIDCPCFCAGFKHNAKVMVFLDTVQLATMLRCVTLSKVVELGQHRIFFLPAAFLSYDKLLYEQLREPRSVGQQLISDPMRASKFTPDKEFEGANRSLKIALMG